MSQTSLWSTLRVRCLSHCATSQPQGLFVHISDAPTGPSLAPLPLDSSRNLNLPAGWQLPREPGRLTLLSPAESARPQWGVE